MAESKQKIKVPFKSLKLHLQDQGWAINTKTSTTVQFLETVWYGQTKEIPEKIQQTVQKFPVPTTVKQLQTFLGILGYWRTFIPHLAVLMHPLQK